MEAAVSAAQDELYKWTQVPIYRHPHNALLVQQVLPGDSARAAVKARSSHCA